MRSVVLTLSVLVAACGTPDETAPAGAPAAPASPEAPAAQEAPAAEAPKAVPAEFGVINLEELAPLVEAGQVVLLDANGTAMFQEGRIPGAIDFEAHEANLAEVLPADKAARIVAYCGGPSCGAWRGAAEAAAKLGYTNIQHFPGGISGWREADKPVESGS